MSKLKMPVNKRMAVAACAAAIACAALAEESAPPPAAEASAAEEAVAEEEDKLFEAGFDNDLFTAFVWRNAVSSDRAVWQPCVWADLTAVDPFWLGFSVWQNWDLSNRRAADGVQRAMNETDYNVHLGATAWASADEAYSLDLEVGHEWYTYAVKEWAEGDWPSSNEIYVKATFNNPFVGIYAQCSEAYHPVTACHFEGGLTKEVALTDTLTLGADWNVNFASGKYFTSYLYGVGGGQYDPEGEEFARDYLGNGIGGTTLKGALTWQACEHFSLGLVLAYTAVLHEEARENMRESGYCHTCAYGLVWGGIQAKISF